MGKRGQNRTAGTVLLQIREQLQDLPPVVKEHILDQLLLFGPGHLVEVSTKDHPGTCIGKCIVKLLRGEHITRAEWNKIGELLSGARAILKNHPELRQILSEEERGIFREDLVSEDRLPAALPDKDLLLEAKKEENEDDFPW